LWGGLTAVLGGVLFATWGYIDRDDAPSYLISTAETLGLVVPVLFLLGLAGLYARCKGRIGRLGRMGFIVGFAGSGLGVVPGFVNVCNCYGYGAHPILGPLLLLALYWLIWLFAGLVVIGLAAIRTRGLRGWGTLSLMIGAFGWGYYLIDSGGIAEIRSVHVAFGILFSLGWVVLGYALLPVRVRQIKIPL
jgi:hypothetical protein